MAINKVVYGGDTLIDLTSDTVTPPKLKIGAIAHAANGSAIEGELAGVYYGETAPDPSDAPVWIDPSGTADVKYKIYNSVADLGLAIGSATIAGALTALPESGILICAAGGFTTSEVPNIYGTIELKKRATARPVVQFFGRSKVNGDWRMFCNSDGTPSGTWVRDDLATEEATPSASSGTLVTGSSIRRSGNTVNLNFGVSGINIPTSSTQIGSIPSEFAPANTTWTTAIVGFGSAVCYADVTSAGAIRIRGNSAVSDAAVRFQLTWAT